MMGMEWIKSVTLNGYGSYVLGVATILYGICGYLIDAKDSSSALNDVWSGLALVFLRRGVSNEVRKVSSSSV